MDPIMEPWDADRFRQVLDSLMEGCQVIGPKWRYRFVNTAAAAQGKSTKEQLIGRTMMEAYPGIETTELFQHLKRCMEIRIPSQLQNEFTFPDGSTGWFELRIEPVPDGIFILSIDITDRKRLDEQNLRLQRMESVGSLAGGIVHDMNNILGPIMMTLASLRRKLTDPKDHRMLELLEANSKRAADLIKQVLTFSRGSESKRSPLSLALVLNETLNLVKPTFPANIALKLNVPKTLWSVSADSTQIQQVLMNLSLNARDAMPKGGTLSFNAENLLIDDHYASMNPGIKPGYYVLLTVSDTGTGMSPEVKSNIFNPFFTTKEIGKGTGLGLSTVMSIVKGHAGLLDVQSEIGKGTQFKVYLPAIESSETRQSQEEILNAVRGNGQLILMVDDDAVVCEIAMISLEANGYAVMTTTDSTEALALYAKHQEKIDLVVTDMDMPFLDGASLSRAMRKLNSNVIIIGSSGTANKVRMDDFMSSGITDFLPKPYTAETLLQLIHLALTH